MENDGKSDSPPRMMEIPSFVFLFFFCAFPKVVFLQLKSLFLEFSYYSHLSKVTNDFIDNVTVTSTTGHGTHWGHGPVHRDLAPDGGVVWPQPDFCQQVEVELTQPDVISNCCHPLLFVLSAVEFWKPPAIEGHHTHNCWLTIGQVNTKTFINWFKLQSSKRKSRSVQTLIGCFELLYHHLLVSFSLPS